MYNYEIINNRGHYEIYFNGEFIGSEDTYSEAEETIKKSKGEKNENRSDD